MKGVMGQKKLKKLVLVHRGEEFVNNGRVR